jgi:glycosyltransferase involved in cell wall biosynthesis
MTTVVLPVWDAYVDERLQEALESLREQTPSPRVVVVDNASRVALPQLSAAEVVRVPRRVSVGAARNVGLEHVGTPYVMFWDADDLMLPGTVEFLEERLRSAPDLAACAAAIVDEGSGERHRWPRRWIAGVIGKPRLFALLDCLWSIYPTTGATLMRTELVRGAGGYGDAEYGDDWQLGVALAFRGPLGWSERPGRLYRSHPDSLSARHLTIGGQLAHARAVRRRVRSDSGIPRWARRSLPLIVLGQYVALVAHMVLREFRASCRKTGRRFV